MRIGPISCGNLRTFMFILIVSSQCIVVQFWEMHHMSRTFLLTGLSSEYMQVEGTYAHYEVVRRDGFCRFWRVWSSLFMNDRCLGLGAKPDLNRRRKRIRPVCSGKHGKGDQQHEGMCRIWCYQRAWHQDAETVLGHCMWGFSSGRSWNRGWQCTMARMFSCLPSSLPVMLV